MTFLGRTVRKKDVPRLAVFASAFLVITLFIAALFTTFWDIHQVRGEISDCNEAIAQKESELKQLEQKKEYYESDEFLEDAVRDSGYVGRDDTVFVITD